MIQEPNNDELKHPIDAREIDAPKKQIDPIEFSSLHPLLYSKAPHGIFILNDLNQIISANTAACSLLGYEEETLTGMDITQLIHPRDRIDIPFLTRQKILENPSPLPHEHRYQKADQHYIQVSVTPGAMPDSPERVIMFHLSDQKQPQIGKEEKEVLDKLYQAQKLEAIGNLSAGIAHDFNNILSGILGASQLAKLYTNKPEKIGNELDKVIKGAHRAADLVQQILTFSRQSDYKKQPLKIRILVKEVLKLIRASLPSTIEIKQQLESNAMIMADPGRIHQVIMNLCTNAYHAMGETGGVLTVGTREIQLTRKGLPPGLNLLPGNYLVIEVRDTGQGISPKDMDKIFDPYFTSKPPDTGTGLGLSVVHGIVEEHKGFIKVKSKLNQGSVFQVFFPVTGTPTPATIPEENPIFPLFGTEKIMIVDDEEYILNSTKCLLEDYGYTTVSFSNGMEALEEFKKNPRKFDLIITDMTMPGMTGNEFAAKVLKIRPEVPIILCSGYNQATAMENAQKMGIRQVLQKPVNLEKMTLMVRELLDENQTP